MGIVLYTDEIDEALAQGLKDIASLKARLPAVEPHRIRKSPEEGGGNSPCWLAKISKVPDASFGPWYCWVRRYSVRPTELNGIETDDGEFIAGDEEDDGVMVRLHLNLPLNTTFNLQHTIPEIWVDRKIFVYPLPGATDEPYYECRQIIIAGEPCLL